MASQRELADQAQRLWEQARNYLTQTLQPGNPRAFAQGLNRANLNQRSPYANPNQGQSFQAGRMPTPAEITQFVQQQPEYQAIMRKMKGGASGGNGGGSPMPSPSTAGYGPPTGQAAASNPSDAMALYNKWMEGRTADYKEAKAANEGRYAEGKGELGGVRDFRQQLYANFGQAAQQDIDERLSETAKSLRAKAAARGLANSNEPDAYILRASRDAAREQQRVREARDSRLADAYAQDTGNLVGFIERRQDPYPDMNQAFQIGVQLSGAEADRQAQAARTAALEKAISGTGGRGASDVRLPPIPGPQGGVSPMFMGANPYQAAQMFFGQGATMQPGIGSNRYPTPRGYAPPQAPQGPQPQASGGGITSNSHPVGMAANLAGLAYNAKPWFAEAADNVGNLFYYGLGDKLRSYDGRNLPTNTVETHPKAYELLNGIEKAGQGMWKAAEYLGSKYWTQNPSK